MYTGNFDFRNFFKIIWILILPLFLIPVNVFCDTLNVTRYFNELTDFTGIFDSPKYGLIISNSTGTYILDKETGKSDKIPGSNNGNFSNSTVIFEFEGNLYFNDKWNKLYIYDGDYAREISSGLKSYLIYNDKLYMLFDFEPRIQVHTKDEIFYTSIGETNDSPISELKIFNGTVYGYMWLNWSGNAYLFKFVENSPEYLIHPSFQNFPISGNYDMVRDFVVVVNNEIWFMSFQGLFKFTPPAGLNTEFDENMTLARIRHNSIELIDEYFVGYTQNNIYSFNLNTKEEKILLEFSNSNWRYKKIMDSIFYLIDNDIYKLNKSTMQVEQVLQSEYEIKTFHVSDNGLFVAYQDRINWYFGNGTKSFGGDGLYTNTFYSLAHDRKNDKIVALGKSGNHYLYQSYENNKWSHSFVPDSVVRTSYNDKSNLEIDYDGRYFFSFRNILAVKDGNIWTKHSFLRDPDSDNPNQRESYYIILTDSAGNVWINSNLSEYKSDGKHSQENSLWYYSNNKFNFQITSISDRTAGRLKNGICMPNGTIYFDVSEKYFLKFMNNRFFITKVSDGIDKPFTNDSRRLGISASNELITTYDYVKGWQMGYGNYTLEAGVSALRSDDTWDHDTYMEIALKYFKTADWMSVLTDKYNNTWLYRNDKWLRFNGNNTFKKFTPSISSPTFSPVGKKVILFKGDMWFATDGNGLFKVEVPDPVTSVTENHQEYRKVILSIEDNSSILRLQDKYEKYSICGIDASPIITGEYNNLINISTLPSGVYFIVVESDNNYIFEKFVVLR
ncbi:MAG: T9SS type A sorting domain-containing protein [Candidatus Kapabacteria bacterium]|nr:T9SS type A sorting domain-containing protein [Ignavibacteriota bacterium]MCW5884439.1 T9SS type A sorting domain-containing protein [Candidatus Kapabacteria bacterium]